MNARKLEHGLGMLCAGITSHEDNDVPALWLLV